MTTIFKIQSLDGLYSRGRCQPTFDKKGKTWNRASDLSNHLANLSEYGAEIYSKRGAVIVQFEVTEEPVLYHRISDWKIGMDSRREKRTRAAAIRQQEMLVAWKREEIKKCQERLEKLKLEI